MSLISPFYMVFFSCDGYMKLSCYLRAVGIMWQVFVVNVASLTSVKSIYFIGLDTSKIFQGCLVNFLVLQKCIDNRGL